MEDLSRLRRKRAAHRTYVLKTLKSVDDLLQDYNASNKGKLKAFRDVLNDKLGVLSELNTSILDQVEDDEIDKEIEETSDLKGDIQERIVNIELVIRSDRSSSESEDEGGSLYAATSVSSSKKSSAKKKDAKQIAQTVKLPKLVIKKFGGNHAEYQSFWDSFDATIHSNESLNDIEKLNYLRSYLEGPAAATITGLALTKENYRIAVDLLRERFGNKQVIISSHMDSLLKIPRVTLASDIKRVRDVYDKIEINVRSLQALGIKSEMYGSLLIPVMMEKIPEEFRLVISRKMKSDTWDINELLDAFKEELEAREKSRFVGGSSNVVEKPLSKQNKLPEPITAAALHSSEQLKMSCFFCNHPGHKSFNCVTVTDPVKRKEILKRKGRCFVCLKRGHVASSCPLEYRCFKCCGRHHVSVCSANFQIPPSGNGNVTQPSPSLQRGNTSQDPGTTSTLYVNAKNSVLLQTATAIVSNPTSMKLVQARLIFDSGSQRTYISSRLRKALDLPSLRAENLLIKKFGGDTEEPSQYDVVQFCVTRLGGGGLNLYVEGYSVPSICAPLSQQKIEFAKSSYEHLSSLELADSSMGGAEMAIDILIGSDFYWQFMTGETQRGRRGGPVAIRSHLGWVLSGPVHEPRPPLVESSVNLTSTHVLRLDAEEVKMNCPLQLELSKFWDLEALGVMPESEDEVYKQFLNKVQMKEGRYEVSLPWKNMHPALPDNYSLSYSRLASLITRLRKTPAVLSEYDSVIRDQESKGIIENVGVEPPGKVHYLPHREVVRSDKQTTKLRIVFDASSKRNGPSLNDCVYPGPPLSPLLMDIMMRFRCFKFALVGDIEKAFLMVGVDAADRDALRFLWVQDPFAKEPKVEVKRFTRLVFGVSSSPFLLNATLKYHLNKYAVSDPEFVKKILKALYVDDLTTGGQTVNETYKLFLKTKLRMLEAGFNMRKWSSNSRELVDKIKSADYREEEVNLEPKKLKEDDRTYATTTLGTDHEVNEEREHKVLGITWDHDSDELIIDLSQIIKSSQNLPVTKRTVLKLTAQVYDSLGWISPVLIEMKLLFQKICQTKGDWDEELSLDLKQRYEKWITELKNVGSVRIPRCYFSKDESLPSSLQLHGFRSSYAYAAAVYLRIERGNNVRSVLITSKTRVAPLGGQTIPRLELLGALILARLISHVAAALSEVVKIGRVHCWVDSTAVLYWILGEQKQWKQFVQNRVVEIRSLVGPTSWSYCPTDANPADLPSRGMNASELSASDEWWSGPNFLTLPEEQWPQKPDTSSLEENVVHAIESECKKEALITTANLVTESKSCLSECFGLERFSGSKKLFQVTVYVRRFITRLKEKVRNIRNSQPADELISVEELEDAEVLWLKEVQRPMSEGNKFDQQKVSLGVYADAKGVYRCQGRLENSALPYEMKHPALLPAKGHLTSLIVRECHERVMHRGIKDTLTELRSRYWLPKGRQVVKRQLRNCVLCSKLQGKPFSPPAAPNLPEFRVEKSFAFANTGVDFAGPLYVKNVFGGESKMYKSYIALYTCASTRAVHLDLVPALDAQSFIKSLKRFLAHRGVNKLFVSDNAKTFKSQDIQQFVRGHGIEWKFNMPRSPWWGGFFERMVRCTKGCLKKTLGSARLTYEELTTVLTEIESVLNSRPLTYVYEDEIEEPLTPSHLMLGRRLLSNGTVTESAAGQSQSQLSSVDITKRVKHLKLLLEHFSSRWQREYLTELRQFHQYAANDKRTRLQKELATVKEGDVVIVKEENRPRGTWKLGHVKELIKGRDKKTRGTVLTVVGNKGRLTELRRPVQHLVPVECRGSVSV